MVLALPGSAQAATFYASDSVSGTGDCLSVANSCTIAVALPKIAMDPGTADVLYLAAGNYSGGLRTRSTWMGPA